MTTGADEYAEKRITYWGWTDGKVSGKWLRGELDHESLLDELESRSLDSERLFKHPSGRGVLARVYRETGTGLRTLKLFKVEPAGVISILRGEIVEEYDPGQDASLMYPSWFRFHPGNRVALLRGPGGAGKADLVEFLNGLEPALFENAPTARKGTSVGLVALQSQADSEMVSRASRVNGLRVSLPATSEVEIESSLVSDVIDFIRKRVGSAVTVKLELTAVKNADGGSDAAAELQQEVGRIIQSDDLAKFRAARMKYDANGQANQDLDLLSEIVAARVLVLLGPANVMTDVNCHGALTEAWAQVSERLPVAVSYGGQNGTDESDGGTQEA